MGRISILRVGGSEPIVLAAAELRKYLGRMAGSPPTVAARNAYDAATPGLWLGTFDAFGTMIKAKSSGDQFDDEIYVDVRGGCGVIAGVNPRSVLLAAYRYLTELGCRWVRPGRDGEFVPPHSHAQHCHAPHSHLPGSHAPGSDPRDSGPLARRVIVHELPSYRHRCVCIEGAVGWEHVRDMIEWLPRIGMNGYFVQFREGYEFFRRWYRHELNPQMKPCTFSVGHARRIVDGIRRETQRRGMILHMVGHGWTCEPFGIPGTGWVQNAGEIPATARQYLAQVNGRRDLWGGIALNTNLCYGNPAARRIMVNAIAGYAAEHPEVGALHLWLADGANNNCECPRCRNTRPSDFYVKLLNQVDAELTRRGLPTRIVFLIYVDLLWPPQTERIANPGRFILMFAPITRTYSTSFVATGRRASAAIPPYRRNKLVFPRTVDANLAFLRRWQKLFRGDSFDFDYHLMWDHVKDRGHQRIAAVMHEDVRGLRSIGLNGLVSCQVQRCFLPTALPMVTMARTLWDRGRTFASIADDYFASAFGADGRHAKRFLQKATELLDAPFLRGEGDDSARAQAARKLDRVPAMIGRFLPMIETNLHLQNKCHAQSWRYLKHHAEICLAAAPAFAALARGDTGSARLKARALFDLVRRKEKRIHRVLDVNNFISVLAGPFGFKPEDLRE